MTCRLFCEHCDKFYEVDTKEIRLMQKQYQDAMHFAHNTYFYTGGCFFEKLKETKKSLNRP